MDVLALIQEVASAAGHAGELDTAAQTASDHLDAVKATAQATLAAEVDRAERQMLIDKRAAEEAFASAVGPALKASQEAQQAAQDARVAGQRLKDQLNAALGNVFSSDPRVRMG